MNRRTIALVLVSLIGLAGCLHTPMAWSPDGSWIAYVVERHPLDPVLTSGPLFKTAGSAKPGNQTIIGYQIWATQASSGSSVLLEESPAPLTAPGWSPDGRALAFGRVVTDSDRSSRFEVVVLEGLARRRIISTRPMAALDAEASRLPFQAIVWSPDGRYLAVPNLEPMGLAILRADNGRVVNVIADAFLPAWSPAGGRLAFFVRSGTHSLHYIESAQGQPRPLMDVGQAQQAPAWTRDGTSIYVVARRGGQKSGDSGENQELAQIQIRGDQVEILPVRALAAEFGPGRERAIDGVSITFDKDVENLFCSTVVEGQPHQVSWIHPRDNAIFKRFPMLDSGIPVTALSMSPDGRTLAARVATHDSMLAPILCDTQSTDLRCRLMAPDDSARLEWIAILTRAARSILNGLPQPTIKTDSGTIQRVERPMILPVNSDFNANADMSARLRRIGKFGRPLCDRPAGSLELDPATRAIFEEATLLFDYLREDYGAVLTTLARLEENAAGSERQFDLMTTRAQVLINQGQFDAARRILSFLDRVESPITRRLEWTGRGYQLHEEISPSRGWPRYLIEASTQAQAAGFGPTRLDPPPEPAPDRMLPLFRPAGPLRAAPPVEEPAPFRRAINRRMPVVPRANNPK